MRLLFDENLSPELVSMLGGAFPESMHIDELGMRGSSDTSIWDYAGANGLTIVSKDNDFRQRARGNLFVAAAVKESERA